MALAKACSARSSQLRSQPARPTQSRTISPALRSVPGRGPAARRCRVRSIARPPGAPAARVRLLRFLFGLFAADDTPRSRRVLAFLGPLLVIPAAHAGRGIGEDLEARGRDRPAAGLAQAVGAVLDLGQGRLDLV